MSELTVNTSLYSKKFFTINCTVCYKQVYLSRDSYQWMRERILTSFYFIGSFPFFFTFLSPLLTVHNVELIPPNHADKERDKEIIGHLNQAKVNYIYNYLN